MVSLGDISLCVTSLLEHGVPFVIKVTIQSTKVLHVDIQFHGDDPLKQR